LLEVLVFIEGRHWEHKSALKKTAVTVTLLWYRS